MRERRWSFKETGLLIKSDGEQEIEAGIEAALLARREIELFIARNPAFRWSLEPLRVPGNHPRAVELMLEAGELAGVGPFAAVAGAISQVAAEAIVEAGGKNVLVENGGDIAIFGDRDFCVGVFAGEAKRPGKLGFLVRAEELPIGICTSSGTVGHSVSFGEADAAVVMADEAPLADAAATSVANAVRGDGGEKSVERGLERAKLIPKIRGCLIVRGGHVGTWGRVPELTRVEFNPPQSRSSSPGKP